MPITPDKPLLLICYLLTGAACFLIICGSGSSGTEAGSSKLKGLFNIGQVLLFVAAVLMLTVMIFYSE